MLCEHAETPSDAVAPLVNSENAAEFVDRGFRLLPLAFTGFAIFGLQHEAKLGESQR